MTRHLSALFALLFSFVFQTSSAFAQDCSLHEVASLDFQPNQDPSVVVEISIAGKPFHFLVDTGGVYSYIFEDTAKALHLQPHTLNGLEVYGADGSKSESTVLVPDLKIGPIVQDLHSMIVKPRNQDYAGIDGILAPDVLRSFDLDFDFTAKKLNLFSPDHCPGKVVYWSKNYAEADFKVVDFHIFVYATLDGHDISAVLDTGSGRTYLDGSISKNVFGIDASTPGIELETDIAMQALSPYRFRFKSLSLSGLEVKSPLINIQSDIMMKEFRKVHNGKSDFADPAYGVRLEMPNAVIGMNVISKLHLYVSYQEEKLYFTGAGAH